MADPDKKVQPGTPVEFSASGWNAQVEAGRAERARQFDQRGDGPESLRHAEIVQVLNDTTDDLPRRAVLGLEEPLWIPSASLDAFLREVTFRGVVPTGQHVGKFGILLDPAGPGRVARAYIAGVVQVQVAVAYEAYTCAEVGVGLTEALQAVAYGSAQILWREGEYDDGDSFYDVHHSRLGKQWAIVRLGTTCQECVHTLIVRFGPFDAGGLFVGTPGIAWRLDHVTGPTTTTVASGTTDASGYVAAPYTPTGDDESYVLVYQSPQNAGQGVQLGTVEISATVVPPHTHDCRHFVMCCPACVEVTGCCDTTYAYEDPTIHVSGGPLTTPFDLHGLIDGDIIDHPGDAHGLAHYVVGCVYLPEGTYSVDLTDPDLPPTSAPKPLVVACILGAYGYTSPNDVIFDLDFTPTALGNPDVAEHLVDTLTLSDGTGDDITLTRPAPAGIPGARELWWGCKVFPNIKTVDWSLPASGGQSRCDGRYFVGKPACTVNPYEDRPDLEFSGADVAVGYKFDGCTLTLYALRCEYEQFIPPACNLRSNYQCDDLIAALAGHGPAPTPPAPPNGFAEVSTLTILTAKPTECYPTYRWEKVMPPVRPCDPGSDPTLFDPVTHEFYQFHYVQNCPVDRSWAFVFYPGGATFVIVPA